MQDRKIITFISIMTIVVFLSLSPWCFAAWDNDEPDDSKTLLQNNAAVRANNDALEVELGIDLAEAHPYYQASAPTKKPDGSTALDVDDNGRMWVDSDDNTIYVLTDYSVPTWTSAAGSGDISESDASFTLTNTDEEDSDGGRQSRWVNKGEQSGGEATTLGYIEFSHDGTGDDQKGQVLIKVNDGDDDDAPSKQAIGYLSTGKIDVSSSLSVLDEDTLSSDDDEVLATQQSIKAYVDSRIRDYIHIVERVADNTAGTTLGAGAWTKVVLSDELNDTGSDATLSSGVVALLAGTYEARISVCVEDTDNAQSRLYDTSNTTTLLLGTKINGTSGVQIASHIVGRFTLSGTTNLEVQVYPADAGATGTQWSSSSGEEQIFCQVEFWKIN